MAPTRVVYSATATVVPPADAADVAAERPLWVPTVWDHAAAVAAAAIAQRVLGGSGSGSGGADGVGGVGGVGAIDCGGSFVITSVEIIAHDEVFSASRVAAAGVAVAASTDAAPSHTSPKGRGVAAGRGRHPHGEAATSASPSVAPSAFGAAHATATSHAAGSRSAFAAASASADALAAGFDGADLSDCDVYEETYTAAYIKAHTSGARAGGAAGGARGVPGGAVAPMATATTAGSGSGCLSPISRGGVAVANQSYNTTAVVVSRDMEFAADVGAFAAHQQQRVQRPRVVVVFSAPPDRTVAIVPPAPTNGPSHLETAAAAVAAAIFACAARRAPLGTLGETLRAVVPAAVEMALRCGRAASHARLNSVDPSVPEDPSLAQPGPCGQGVYV
jgi:hypothetical protein